MKAELSVIDAVLVVSLEGKVLEETILKQLLSDIESKLSEVRGRLVINLERLDYINSTGIGFFIKALTKSRVHNGDMVLSGARGSVLSIVTISKMNEVFTMTETVEDAVEKFKK